MATQSDGLLILIDSLLEIIGVVSLITWLIEASSSELYVIHDQKCFPPAEARHLVAMFFEFTIAMVYPTTHGMIFPYMALIPRLY